jgi:DNA-nicking Smr family endonuclease
VTAPSDDEPVSVPIDGTLDLHTFDPREIGDLLPEFLRACRERGILEVRIVHGKGGGVLQRSVRTLLGRLPDVVSSHPADAPAGRWGATLVRLKPVDKET